MQINSIQPYVNKIDTTVKKHPNATRAIAAAAVASTSVLVATKAPKGAVNQLKVSQRLSRAGIAGGIALAAISLLSVNKEQVVQAVNKVKQVFKRNSAEKELDKTQPIDTSVKPSQNEQININEAKITEEQPNSSNPFAPKENITSPATTDENLNSTNPFSQENTSLNPFVNGGIQNFALNKELNINPVFQKPNMVGALSTVKPDVALNAGMVSSLG